MQEINYYSINSKLNLHKLAAEVDESKKTITIGKSQIESGKIIFGIGVILTAILFLIVTVNAGATSPMFVVALILVGAGLIASPFTKRKGNKSTKIISPEGIRILLEGKETFIPSNEVETFEIVTGYENEEAKGLLTANSTNGDKHLLVMIIDKEPKHVRADLEFLCKQFTLIVRS